MSEKSLVCPLSMAEKDRKRILNETENFADYIKLGSKDRIHMLLLTEELLGMQETLVGANQGSFWLEASGNSYEIHLNAKAAISERSGAMLVETSSDKKNAAYKGMSGKLRQVFDVMTNPKALSGGSGAYALGTEIEMTAGFAFGAEQCEWSYKEFQSELEREKIIDSWDGLEYSVLAKLAEDITVSVRNDQAEIIVKAKRGK